MTETEQIEVEEWLCRACGWTEPQYQAGDPALCSNCGIEYGLDPDTRVRTWPRCNGWNDDGSKCDRRTSDEYCHDHKDVATDGGTERSASDTDRTEETLSYAVVPEGQGGTVTVTVSTTDDEGIHGHDRGTVEVEVPWEGAVNIDIESDEVGLVPNSFDGNPRIVDTERNPNE